MDIPQAELVDALADAAVEEALCRLALAAGYGDLPKARAWLEHSLAVQEYCRTEHVELHTRLFRWTKKYE